MAAPDLSLPDPKPPRSAQKRTAKKPRRQHTQAEENGEADTRSEPGDAETLPPAPKRNNCPGVRVIGGRIYDSELGKTCHQCRQKTLDFSASCKNVKVRGRCPTKYCHKCLLNRYGEKAEEVDALNDWKCPKCRDACNCSFCMKKRGDHPTGILVLQAKASGFISVSDMLNNYKNGCAQKSAAVTKKSDAPPVNVGKENHIDGSSSLMLDDQGLSKIGDEKNSKRTKLGGSKEMQPAERNGVSRCKKKSCIKSETKNGINPGKRKISERKVSFGDSSAKHSNASEAIKKDDDKVGASLSLKCTEEDDKEKNGSVCKYDANIDEENLPEPKPCTVKDHSKSRDEMKAEPRDFKFYMELPQGIEVSVVADIELPPEGVGDALQFLEFCATFSEKLDIREGLPKCILRELLHGRPTRQSRYSSAAQFHTLLLSLILNDSDEESSPSDSKIGTNSWLQALEKWSSESQCSFKEFPTNCFQQGKYEKLDSIKKLKLLNLLCDETLCTVNMRTWMEDQNKTFLVEKKEAKARVFAAKDNMKSCKRKLQDEVAKAIIEKNGAPLSISEHDEIVSQSKAIVDQAKAELSNAMDVETMRKQETHAVRTTPILRTIDGKVYWRLNGYSPKPHILLQDMDVKDIVLSGEKWFALAMEQEPVIEKYLSFIRKCR